MMEFEMPTPCTECGEIFELHDGRPNPRSIYVVICAGCADKADEEVERDEEIEEIRREIEDAEYDMQIASETIRGAKDRLRELGIDPEVKKETQTQPDLAPMIRL
jgi:hypothetical protein